MLRPTHRAFATTFTAATLTGYTALVPVINKGEALIKSSHIHPVTPVSWPTMIIACVVAWVIASVPDLDNLLKRYKVDFIPIAHRGFTHTIWIVLLFAYLTIRAQNPYVGAILLGITLGWASHIVADAFSTAGVAIFYPFQRYNRYSSGAMVVRGRRGIFQPIYTVGDQIGPINPKYYYYVLTGIILIIYIMKYSTLIN